MENVLTKKQAEALYKACTQLRVDVQDIMDVDSFEYYSDWVHYLRHISFEHTLPVDMGEFYNVLDNLSLALLEKLIKGEFK